MSISGEIWPDVVSNWEFPPIRRESNHIRNKIGRPTRVEVVVGLGFGLKWRCDALSSQDSGVPANS